MSTALDPQYDRAPLVNYEAEQALLAAILADNRAYESVVETLKAEHFAEEIHGRIYAACGALIDSGKNASAITLKSFFENEKALKDVGGTEYLVELQANFVSLIGARDYAELVTELWSRRRLVAISEDAIDESFAVELERPFKEIRERAEARLADLADGGEHKGLEPMSSTGMATLKDIERARQLRNDGYATAVSTGFKRLDRALCGGLRGGQLIFIGGATSMGKSALATAMALNAAELGWPGAYFSAEMRATDVGQRLLAQRSGLDLMNLIQGSLTDDDMRRVIAAEEGLHDLPLYIDQGMSSTVQAIRSRAQRMKRAKGLGLIVVDYLQLLASEGRDKRVDELTRMTRQLKRMSVELDVPTVVLSQLSRAHQARDNKRPQLADLRESGSIEQDADIVLFTYREHYYLSREEPRDPNKVPGWQADLEACKNRCEIIIAKQRQGPLGTVVLGFEPHTTRFHEDAQGAML